MTELPFSWQMQYGNTINPIKNRMFSNLKLNAEWSLMCFWSADNTKPTSLEIRRNSLLGDVIVSGSFKLAKMLSCVLQRKIVHLIEAGLTTMVVDLEHSTDSNSVFALNRGAGFPHAQAYSINGALSITPGMVYKQPEKEIPLESILELSNDLGRLLDPQATYFADAILTCGSASFSVHKSILSVRSPVLATMFTVDMKEKRENQVDITDISPHVLQTMLFYIYTGKTRELTVQSAGELLFAADKYELQDLKKVCGDYLKSCMGVENVLNALVLGYLHHSDLEASAVNFMCNSCEEFEVIEKTEEWRELREKIPSLVMDVYSRVVKYKEEKLKRYK